MAQEQQQINGVDMGSPYEDFKKRHAARTPTEFAKVMHRMDPEHGLELEWWSDDPDIVEWFSIAIIKKFGWLKGSGKMQIKIPYWNMPSLRIERDGNTGVCRSVLLTLKSSQSARIFFCVFCVRSN